MADLVLETDLLDELLLVSRDNLVSCHPMIQGACLILVERLWREDGLAFAVFQGNRPLAVQRAFYAQGREELEVVNRLRHEAGLGSIDLIENKKRVTKVKFSWHNLGLAADLVEDGDITRVGIQWSWASATSYLKIGRHAKDVGLAWGGFWKAWKDYPHVEQPFAELTLEQAWRLYQLGGKELVWRRVDALRR